MTVPNTERYQTPTGTFEGCVQSGKHTNAIRNQPELRQMSVKGCVYEQMHDRERKQMVRTKERNSRVIKKLLKTLYYVVKKEGFTRKFY